MVTLVTILIPFSFSNQVDNYRLHYLTNKLIIIAYVGSSGLHKSNIVYSLICLYVDCHEHGEVAFLSVLLTSFLLFATNILTTMLKVSKAICR